MTGRGRALARGLTALTVAAAGLVGASAAPAAADPGLCTPTTGVVVAVDFRPFGGSIERGCDPTPTTGLEAIHTAGFPTVGTTHDGPGFVCRIKGLPTMAAEPCVVTPPASRYWSYWHADPGQSGWSYSQLGAASYRPKAGSVDAWVFGATDVGGTTGGPTFSPSAVRATAPVAPPPTTGGGGAGGGTGGGGTGGGGTGGGDAAAPAPVRPPPATGGRAAPSSSTAVTAKPGAGTRSPNGTVPPSSTSSGAPDPSTASTSETTSASAAGASTGSTSTDPPVIDVRAGPTAAETSTDSAWSTVAAVVLVLALGGGAGVVALRRRRAMD